MTKKLVLNDAWVVGQLAGIRTMERELSQDLKASGPSEDLRRRVEQLNAWVNLVDNALTARARLSVAY